MVIVVRTRERVDGDTSVGMTGKDNFSLFLIQVSLNSVSLKFSKQFTVLKDSDMFKRPLVSSI